MRKNASHRAAEPAGMTVAAYARRRHVSRRAVYDALDAGRITRRADGTIDAAAADRAWTTNTVPHVGGKPRPKPAEAAEGAARRRPARVRVSEEAVAAGEAEARRLVGKGAAEVLSFAEARRARELVKLAREALELRRMREDTFSKAEVANYVTARVRTVRDALLTIPPREAATGAAQLGIDEGALYRWLADVIRRFLQRQADGRHARQAPPEDAEETTA
jgi:hypothetical protein